MKLAKMVGVALVAVVTILATSVRAENIRAGWDYFHSLEGTKFDFGPGIGVVPLEGNPIDPGTLYNTDTIVQREVDVDFSTGPEVTIPITMRALSLESVDPVWVPGPDSFFDVFITLDPKGPDQIPGTPDDGTTPGTGTFRHEWADDGTSLAEGTFDSWFSVWADALFVPPGQTEPAFIVDINGLGLEAWNTPWSHEHDLVPPLPGASNFYLAEIPPNGGGGGHPRGWVHYEYPGGYPEHEHDAENATPEPSSLLLLGLGVLVVARKRS